MSLNDRLSAKTRHDTSMVSQARTTVSDHLLPDDSLPAQRQRAAKTGRSRFVKFLFLAVWSSASPANETTSRAAYKGQPLLEQEASVHTKSTFPTSGTVVPRTWHREQPRQLALLHSTNPRLGTQANAWRGPELVPLNLHSPRMCRLIHSQELERTHGVKETTNRTICIIPTQRVA